MPVYKYEARDIAGKTIRGRIEAADTESMLSQIRDQRLFLLSYEAASEKKQGRKMNGKDLADFNRQIGAMLTSGVSLLRSFEIMLRRDISQAHKQVYEAIYTELLKGVSFSDAMEGLGRVFPPLMINMYRAAEANGTVDQTALRMAEHFESEYRLNNKIRSAAIYPIVLLVITVVVLVVVFVFILPTFTDLYGDAELPGPTKVVMAIGSLFSQHYIFLIIGVLAVVFGVRALLRIESVRVSVDKFKLKVPVFGKLMRIVVTARFARTLSSLYASGLSILTALEIARGTVLNAYITSQFDELVNDVRIGNSLADSLDKIDGFDKKLSSTVAVGEESGRLESMLNSVADSFDYEAQEAAQRMVSLLEPMLIIIMALLVGFVLVATIMPIYSMYGEIGAGAPGY